MFVLLFVFVFGGVIDVPGGDYEAYLMGGILVQSLAFLAIAVPLCVIRFRRRTTD
jgi:hypothetical protein